MSSLLTSHLTLVLSIVWIALGLCAGIVADRYVLARLLRSNTVVRSYWLSVSLAAMRGVVVVWGAVAGLYCALVTASLPPRADYLAGRILLVGVIGSVTYVVARVAAGAVSAYGQGVQRRVVSASLFSNITQTVVIGFGALIVLSSLGISITPILTALGVGGLAVALALRDTLANLFSGIQIVASRQLRPGDYVRLEGGLEGFVEDVTWRNTTIRELADNLIVVPNEKLAQSIFTNFSLLGATPEVSVSANVPYGCDLVQVERAGREAAESALHDEGLPVARPPSARFAKLTDANIEFTVAIAIPKISDRARVRSAFIKRLLEGLRRVGVEHPTAA